MRRFLFPLLATLMLPAAAQADNFTKMQFNWAQQEFNRIVDRVRSLSDELNGRLEKEKGCNLLSQLISTLANGQIELEKIANAAHQLGYDDAHRDAVDRHNAYLEERKRREAQHARMCV